MASFTQTANGWRAHVYVNGERDGRSFSTKREAQRWAEIRAAEMREHTAIDRKTLADALTRYAEEVSPTKRGERWERVRIASFLRDADFPSEKRLPDCTPEDFGRWRDARLEKVSAGTILRDISLLSAVLETARREWRWIAKNPLSDMRKPRQPDHRHTIILPMQAVKLFRAMSYQSGPCKSATQAAGAAFLFALRTGMRAGEICNLRWQDLRDGYCVLPVTKTKPRDVPLTWQAMRVIDRMRGWDDDLVFGIKSQTLDALFRRYRDRAGLRELHFHDARHTAATRMSSQLDVLTLCKVFGWKNTKQALTYFNPSANDIRRQLERGLSRRPG